MQVPAARGVGVGHAAALQLHGAGPLSALEHMLDYDIYDEDH